MSHPIKVIPSRRWQHKRDGRCASIYGACPASGAVGDTIDDWHIVDVGWTVQNDDGTVGIGRHPWTKKENADKFLEDYWKQLGRKNPHA
jgi:hypothetical protein